MTDLGEIEAFLTKKGPRCSAGKAIQEMDPDTLEKYNAWLRDSRPAPALSKWLLSKGIEVSAYRIRYHERGDCSCER